jgi:hypothetical protein
MHVAAGAAWLDQVAPGWERKVDLSVLDLTDPFQCICGQVVPLAPYVEGLWHTGGYGDVSEWIHAQGSHLHIFHLGFVLPADQDAWVSLIKERFDSGLLSDVP